MEKIVNSSRRNFLGGTAVATLAGAPVLARSAISNGDAVSPSCIPGKVLDLFQPITGRKGVKIWAPEASGAPEFLVRLNARELLFCGSAFKTFVLCEALRQADAPDIDQQLQLRQLELDETVWSPDSVTFNPPYLSGKVSERTTLEAMIIHSDNTGADMSLKLVGADNVRKFIASAGLEHTFIPNSTRQFIGYLANAADWRTITWKQVIDILNSNQQPLINPPLNHVQTMASTAHDFVSYYSRALQGKFFKYSASLDEFRAILSRADAIQQAVPLGASAFVKGGAIDVAPFHALCLAGGMYLAGRWVYFAATLNWDHPGDADPETAGQFVAAITEAFQLVEKALSS